MYIDYGYKTQFDGLAEAMRDVGTTTEKLAVAISCITSSLGQNIENIVANVNELYHIIGGNGEQEALRSRLDNIENTLHLNRWGNNRIEDIENYINQNESRICALEGSSYDYLRPVLDDTTEKLKKLYDLEILKQKSRNDIQINFDTNDLDDWYDNFMKELDETYGSLD